MKTTKSLCALWVLVIALIVASLGELPGQGGGWSMTYNPATGAIVQPTQGKRPLVAAADVLEYSTDANLALTNAHNTVIWNVPAQALTRTITLPVIGDDPDETAQPVFVYVVDANSDAVEVYDADSNLILSMTAVERSRATFYPVADGGTWIAIDQTFGTAAYVNTGTSGATLPLNNANITRSGTLTQSGNVVLSGTTRIYADSASGPYWMKSTALDGWTLTTATNARRFLVFQFGSIYRGGTQNMFFQGNPNSTSYTILEDDAGLGLVLGTSLNTPVYIIPNRLSTSVANFSAAGTLIATGESGGTRIAKLRTEVSTMASGTFTVTDTAVTSGSIILAMAGFASPGTFEYSISPGASFTITSSDLTDAGSVSWQRIVP